MEIINKKQKGKKMKKSRITKIAFFALSALLLIGAVFGISTMAEGEGETPSVEILYKNLEYDDKISILYAVKANAAAGDDLVLNIYDESGALVHTAKNHKRENIKGEDCLVFSSQGLAPKEMTRVLYAQAVATVGGVEYKSAMTSYSITEYCYKRFTVDSENLTDDQKGLYTAVLDFGKYAQNVLNFNEGNTPADYYYFNIDGGIAYFKTVDGKQYNFNTALFHNNSSTEIIVPEYTLKVEAGKVFAGYNVAKYDNAYIKTEIIRANAGDVIKVNAHTFITPVIETVSFEHGGGNYYKYAKKGKRYDFNSATSHSELYQIAGGTWSNDPENVLTHKDDIESKYIDFARPDGNTSDQLYLRYNGTDITAEANYDNHIMVIEQDIKFTGLSTSNAYAYYIDAFMGTKVGNRVKIYFGTNSDKKIQFVGDTLADPLELDQDKWYNIRFEICYSDPTSNTHTFVRVYVNNQYATTLLSELISNTQSTRVTYFIQKPTSDNHGLSIDNLYIGDKAAKEPVNSNAVWGSGINLNVVVQDGSTLDINDLLNNITTITGSPANRYEDSNAQKAHEFVIGNTNRAITAAAKTALNGILTTDKPDGWLIYVDGNSLAAVYTSNAARADMFKTIEKDFYSLAEFEYTTGTYKSATSADNFGATDGNADDARDAAREEGFAKAEAQLGKDTADALRQLYTLYNTDTYKWLANLYDSEVGGFYYSNSGKDNTETLGNGVKKYLPDLESTRQALGLLATAGMFSDVGGYGYYMSDEMKSEIITFVKSLKADDGYYYHPQWGDKNDSITDEGYWTSRRSRDYSSALQLLELLGAKEDTVASVSALTMRLRTSSFAAVSKVVATAETTPTYLQNLTDWNDYLVSLDIQNDPYKAGNIINSQNIAIKDAGPEYVDALINHLNSIQNGETGFWGEGVSDETMDGFMKLSYSYIYNGRAIPNADKALESTIAILLTPDTDNEDLHICNTYNTWENFSAILQSAEISGGAEAVAALRAKITAQAPALINITYEKTKTHTVEGGGFSYFEWHAANESQGATVGCASDGKSPDGALEADVNGTSLATVGIASTICEVLGIEMIPIYVPEDADIFFDLVEKNNTNS